MVAALAPGRGALGKLQAALAAASFMLLLAGTNTTTPLLPLYRDMLGFSPLTVTLTFVAYVSLLVATLAVASGPKLVRYAPSVLVAALAVALLADLALSTGTAPGILAGRALQGVSSGIGTGAAAALVVAVVGNRGRALTATGNLAGAILGTAAAQAVLHLAGARAISISFEIHAGV
ncbi:hypothetical protein [Tropicimonas sp. IMCC6043]|uniref:hypothetical protein n=1 Tax=Tropicimonas sp. IMCC6043 TaxID=2510645 RepID=UPI00101B781C|nr:hypothetical protein [Tropicimonas sp. IMCC6043]RYH11589.1 hypothetical protein EU800_02835 [Tropicimonas sp. IMCC6043]